MSKRRVINGEVYIWTRRGGRAVRDGYMLTRKGWRRMRPRSGRARPLAAMPEAGPAVIADPAVPSVVTADPAQLIASPPSPAVAWQIYGADPVLPRMRRCACHKRQRVRFPWSNIPRGFRGREAPADVMYRIATPVR